MAEHTVVYLEPVPTDVEQIVRGCLPPGLALRVRREGEPVAEALREADFVLVATTPLPAAALAAAPRLRLIQHQGVGYDRTDVAAAADLDIPVALCPAGTSIGVAEHVFLLILALYKQLRAAEAALREGRFLQWELRAGSYELAGKTVGLVGLGRIGREVTTRARAFAANVIYYDVARVAPEAEQTLGVTFVPFAGLLAQADIVSLHLPLTAGTRHLIGAAELALMRRSAVLINTARGPLVDEAALFAALQMGQIASAGLDVFEREPLLAGHPLLGLANVVLTPHIIFLNTPRPAPGLLAAFKRVPSGNVCDAMDRMGALDYHIKPLAADSLLAGPALTVRTRPGDNLMVWKAIDVAQPGDVLVIATYDYTAASTFGERVVMAAKAKGVAGIVCDGMCRDASGIRATGLPTFVRGTVPSSPGKDGPGEIGGPVSCGGMVVHAGDVVIGDEDGVVVVALADAPAVAERLQAVFAKEAHMAADLAAGRLVPEWVDAALAAKGCEIIH